MEGAKYHIGELPAGWIGLVSGGKGLRRATLKPTPTEAREDLGSDADAAEHDAEAFREVVSRLVRYSEGELSALDDIELDMDGAPPFFRAAWSACRRIPPGETRSYRWLAAAAGNPLALRAAGQAMARNRFSLIVPCHRVIASDGTLGGYGGGGLGVKARLLRMEQECAGAGGGDSDAPYPAAGESAGG